VWETRELQKNTNCKNDKLQKIKQHKKQNAKTKNFKKSVTLLNCNKNIRKDEKQNITQKSCKQETVKHVSICFYTDVHITPGGLPAELPS